MSGSKNMSYDSSNLTTPDIKWLGVRPSDLDRRGRAWVMWDEQNAGSAEPPRVAHRFNIPEQCRLPMTEADIQTGKQLLQEDFIKANPKCAHSICQGWCNWLGTASEDERN
jgi:meiotic recombination protein SPO11